MIENGLAKLELCFQEKWIPFPPPLHKHLSATFPFLSYLFKKNTTKHSHIVTPRRWSLKKEQSRHLLFPVAEEEELLEQLLWTLTFLPFFPTFCLLSWIRHTSDLGLWCCVIFFFFWQGGGSGRTPLYFTAVWRSISGICCPHQRPYCLALRRYPAGREEQRVQTSRSCLPRPPLPVASGASKTWSSDTSFGISLFLRYEKVNRRIWLLISISLIAFHTSSYVTI